MDFSDLRAIDGHCHPLLTDPWTFPPETFRDLFSEGRRGTMAAHTPHTAYFRRALRQLARRLGTEARVDAVLARRRQLGADGARRALTESRVTALVVDTGYPPEAMALDEMRRCLPCPVYELFRIETCAQSLVARGLPWAEFVDAFVGELRAAAGRCVGFKSIIAYRSGLAVRPWTDAEAASAYRQAQARTTSEGPLRLTEKPLLDTLFELTLEVARATRRPLQVHTGFGDPDIDLLQANPLLLRPVLEDRRWAEVPIVLLHLAYPYVREAAFMAAVWPQVWVDLSLALPFLGAGAVQPLAELLALAPASKLLYGSDLGGLPELFALAADWARAALGQALGWLGERGEVTADEARAIARQILADNARALYALPYSDAGCPES